jgi:hypothetical protein
VSLECGVDSGVWTGEPGQRGYNRRLELGSRTPAMYLYVQNAYVTVRSVHG